jgi:hypothetical protein
MKHFYENIGEDFFDYQDLYKSIITHFQDGSHFVEVGSWKGRSASFMAVEIRNSRKRIQFDCIDTWDGSEEHDLSDKPKDWLYHEFKKNTLLVSEYINPIRSTSVDASHLYDNRSLDFCFIDAAHDYENVKADIIHWYPKVKFGGVIAGHDYPHWSGVKKAVDEIFPNVTHTSKNCWMIRK